MASTRDMKRAKVYISVSLEEIRLLGAAVMKRDPQGRSEPLFIRRWMAFFGAKPEICVDLWGRLQVAADDPELACAKPEYLLWGLLFLKRYGSEEEMASIAGSEGAVDEKTFRKWSKIFVIRISLLHFDVVSG